jgi:hypothetical protein
VRIALRNRFFELIGAFARSDNKLEGVPSLVEM